MTTPNVPPKPKKTRERIVAITAALLPLIAAVALLVVIFRPKSYDVTIGVEGSRVVEIAGPELSAVPFTHGDATELRIASVVPMSGGFRYDLRYMAFGPGEHDLAPSLKRADGTSPPTRKDLKIKVAALLPEDYSGELYSTPTSPIDLRTRYKFYMGAAWVLWILLLVPLVWFGHKKRRRADRAAPPPSLVERVRALLLQATHENLTIEQKADLEALLLAYWSERLNLSEERLSATIDRLRRHPQAGAQWNRVERWIHSPAAAASERGGASGSIARQLLSDFEALN